MKMRSESNQGKIQIRPRTRSELAMDNGSNCAKETRNLCFKVGKHESRLLSCAGSKYANMVANLQKQIEIRVRVETRPCVRVVSRSRALIEKVGGNQPCNEKRNYLDWFSSPLASNGETAEVP
jgi:hypothetical protein